MDYGLCLPSLGDDSTLAGIEASIDLAEKHGFTDVWVTDHLLVGHDAAEDYGRIYEAVTTLAWAAARNDTLRLGASVIVVPMRERCSWRSSLRRSTRSRAGGSSPGSASAGAGTSSRTWASAIDSTFEARTLEETIALCRHLWSGSTEPFDGRFRPVRRLRLRAAAGPGREPADLDRRSRRAGAPSGRAARGRLPRLVGEPGRAIAARIPIIRAAAEAAGRPMPRLSARVRIELGCRRQDLLHDARLAGGGRRRASARSRRSASTTSR